MTPTPEPRHHGADPYRATIEPLGVAGDVLLLRVCRGDEYARGVLAGHRPSYFAVCTLVRERDDPSVVEVKGMVVPGVDLKGMMNVVRAGERAMREVGIRAYWFERVNGDTDRKVLRTVPPPPPPYRLPAAPHSGDTQ